MYTSQSQLFEALLHDKTLWLLTPNTRLAQNFQKDYARFLRRQGITVYERLPILSYAMMLKKLAQYQEKQLFSDNEAQVLGETIWDEILKKQNLNPPVSLWTLCWKTWKETHHWHFPLQEENFIGLLGNENTALFFQWANAYKKALDEKGAIDEGLLPSVFRPNINVLESTTNLFQNATFILTGFLEIPPSVSALLSTLSLAIQLYTPPLKAKSIHKISFESDLAMMEDVAKWAKKQWQKNPKAKLGCVALKLNANRFRWERILARFLPAKTYDFSLGRALADYPMIAQALQILSLKNNTQDLKALLPLLLSDYLGDNAKRQEDLYEANKLIHQTGNAGLLWTDFFKVLSPFNFSWLTSLQKWFDVKLPYKTTFNHWHQIFLNVLNDLQWPGLGSLSAQDTQVYQHFIEVLEAYAAFDGVIGVVTFWEALKHLKNLCTRTLFQPKKKESQLKIVGQLEAIGLHFDALYVTDMDEKTLPASPKLNSFLSPQLQKKYNFPHSTYEREGAHAALWFDALKTLSSEIIFGFVRMSENIVRKESVLLESIPELNEMDVLLEDELPSVLEAWEDEGVGLDSRLRPKLSLNILRDQALCPFKAFAKHRLKAEGFEKLQRGLDARARGILAHRVFEKFWTKTQDSKTLKNYTKETCTEIIKEVCEAAVMEFFKKNPYKRQKNIHKIFVALEKERLKVLLNRFLELERMRPDFEVVALEQAITFVLNEITLKLRIDRMDKLEDGNFLVIDFKTSNTLPSTSDWLEINQDTHRFDNPQLLGYALAEPRATGIAFAHLKASHVSWKGISAQKMDISGISAISDSGSWEPLKAYWQASLEALAKEFLSGHAIVSPLKNNTCQQCDLQNICRIRELAS